MVKWTMDKRNTDLQNLHKDSYSTSSGANAHLFEGLPSPYVLENGMRNGGTGNDCIQDVEHGVAAGEEGRVGIYPTMLIQILKEREEKLRKYTEMSHKYAGFEEVCTDLRKEIISLKKQITEGNQKKTEFSLVDSDLEESSHIDDSVVNVDSMDEADPTECSYDDFQISHQSFARDEDERTELSDDTFHSSRDNRTQEHSGRQPTTQTNEEGTVFGRVSGEPDFEARRDNSRDNHSGRTSCHMSSERKSLETERVTQSTEPVQQQEEKTHHSLNESVKQDGLLTVEDLHQTHIPLDLLINDCEATQEIEKFCQELYQKYGLDKSNLGEMGLLIQKYFKNLVKASQMEKHVKTKLTLLFSLTEENQQLKLKQTELEQTLEQLKSQLVNQQKQAGDISTTDRTNPQGIKPELSDLSLSLLSSTSSSKLENHQIQMGEFPGGSVGQKPEPTLEEIRLHNQVKELAKANASWELHCQQLAEKHQKQITSIIEDNQHLDSEVKTLKQKHKQHLKEVAQNTEKKIREVTEGQSLLEEQVREAERQAERLRAELGHRDHTVVELTSKLKQSAKTEEQRSFSFTELSERGRERGQFGAEDMDLLMQQVAQYKEDFEKEHKEHERTKKERDYLRSQIYRNEHETHKLSAEIQKVRRDYQTLKTSYKQKHADLDREKEAHKVTQARYSEASSRLIDQLQQFTAGQRNDQAVAGTAHPSSSKPTNPGVRSKKKWSCLACTYENIPQRIICELCGTRAPYDPNTSGTTQIRESSSSSSESNNPKLSLLMPRGSALKNQSIPNMSFPSEPGNLEEDQQ